MLDRRRAGSAGTFLTRLRVGRRLVDADAVPTLYSGRVRPRHLLGTTVAGFVALAAAVATTPVGQGWAEDAAAAARDVVGPAYGSVERTVTDLMPDASLPRGPQEPP